MSNKVLFVIESKKRWLNLGLKDLISFSELLYFFAWRDIKVRYKQTVLGFLWVILQPLALLSIMVFVFGTKFKMTSGSIEYPVFVLSGLIFWNAFSSSVNGAANSMISQSNIIKKIYFPRILIPISGIIVSMFDLFITVVLFFALTFYFDESINYLQLLWCLPLSIIALTIVSLGSAFWAAALTVRFRDFKFIIPVTLQLMMFVTPVIFPLSLFTEEWMVNLLSLNPMVAPVELFRSVLSDNEFAQYPILISMSVSLVILLTGLIYFRKTEDVIADVI